MVNVLQDIEINMLWDEMLLSFPLSMGFVVLFLFARVVVRGKLARDMHLVELELALYNAHFHEQIPTISTQYWNNHFNIVFCS